MKTISLTVLCLCLLLGCATQSDKGSSTDKQAVPADKVENAISVKDGPQEDEQSAEEYLEAFQEILNSYEAFLLQYGNSESQYFRAYETFKSKLESGETAFKFNPDNQETLKGAAKFNYNENDGEYYISAGTGLINIYKTSPSFVYSVLTHEHWHARDYIVDRDSFLRQLYDPFESEYYEADALYVEAMFVDEVLMANGFPITKFESYLLDCYRDNALSSLTSAMYKSDISVLHFLSDVIAEFGDESDRPTMDTKLEQKGLTLLDKFHAARNDDDWEKYSSLVSIKTFVEYSAVTFRKTEGNIDPTQLWDDIFLNYPGFSSVYYQMEEIYSDNRDFVDELNNGYLEYFAEDLFVDHRE